MEAKELQEFVLEQMEARQIILIRGNHEDLFERLVTVDEGLPYEDHLQNGTYLTALLLTGFEPKQAANYQEFAAEARATPFYRRIIPAMLDYYETNHYVFTHGWVPCIHEYDGLVYDEVLERAAKQSFVDRVIEIIRQKGVRDSAVYKAAQIDRRLFSKIMSDKNYKPAKDTAIAIALALQLPLAEANDLLERAGYILSHSNKRDIVIEYFIRERMYSLNKINSVLAMLYLKPIGR